MELTNKRIFKLAPFHPITHPTHYGEVDLQSGLPNELQIQIMIFDENEISTKFLATGYYEKYEDGEFALIANDDEWMDDADTVVFEELDAKAAEKAHQDENNDFFYDESNFKAVKISESYASTREVVEYWNGSNWKDIIIWDEDCPPFMDMERDDRLEKSEWEKIYSTYSGQGLGHDEYYRVILESGERLLIYRPVSYMQSDRNDDYYPVSSDTIKLNGDDIKGGHEIVDAFQAEKESLSLS